MNKLFPQARGPPCTRTAKKSSWCMGEICGPAIGRGRDQDGHSVFRTFLSPGEPRSFNSHELDCHTKTSHFFCTSIKFAINPPFRFLLQCESLRVFSRNALQSHSSSSLLALQFRLRRKLWSTLLFLAVFFSEIPIGTVCLIIGRTRHRRFGLTWLSN